MTNYIGRKVIVRADRTGVFYGTLSEQNQNNAQNIILKNCIRIWRWDGACSLSQLSSEGIKNPDNCKFAMEVNEIELFDVIEIIPCTEEAIKSIEGVSTWKL